jgi:hypothetical protein
VLPAYIRDKKCVFTFRVKTLGLNVNNTSVLSCWSRNKQGEMNSALGFLILQVVLLVVAARDFSIDHANNTFVKVGKNNVLRTCFYICTTVYPYTHYIQINKHVLIHDSTIV